MFIGAGMGYVGHIVDDPKEVIFTIAFPIGMGILGLNGVDSRIEEAPLCPMAFGAHPKR